MNEERMSQQEKSGIEWVEKVSKLETYEISPYEINRSIIEFAKVILGITGYHPYDEMTINPDNGLDQDEIDKKTKTSFLGNRG